MCEGMPTHTGSSCALWGWTTGTTRMHAHTHAHANTHKTDWCYVRPGYSGPGHEFVRPSEVYEGQFYVPCRPDYQDKSINMNGEKIDPTDLQRRRLSVLSFSYNCSMLRNASLCARDGNVSHTVFSMITQNKYGKLLPTRNVTVRARVEARASCEHVHASLSPDVGVIDHKSQRGLEVSLEMVDVDGLPILVTSPPMVVQWGQESSLPVPYERKHGGSNVFTAIISADRLSEPGRFTLTVSLSKGWSSTFHQEMSCQVLNRTIEARHFQHHSYHCAAVSKRRMMHLCLCR